MDLVLIHGMGRTPLSLLRLRQHLRRAGHRPILFGYSPTFETLDGAAGRLADTIDRKVRTAPYGLIGHSLGSVLIRTVLSRLGPRPPAACFFLAPPVAACRAAKFFSRFWPYRMLMGEMGILLADDEFMRRLPMPARFRIYAGTAGPRAAWLPFDGEENDGILSVAEATGDWAAAALRVPALHTFIMNSPQVRDDLVKSLAALSPSPAPE